MFFNCLNRLNVGTGSKAGLSRLEDRSEVAGQGRWRVMGGLLAAAVVLQAVMNPCAAKRQDWPGSPLASETQMVLEKAGKLAKSGKHAQAVPMILSALESANDLPKCLAIATFTEPYGYPMMEVRRQCVAKALSLCSTRQDFIQIALKSRQYQFYEITRSAINSLTQQAVTPSDLFDLARKSQEVALNDVAHMAMEKAYSGIRSVPEAVQFALEVKALGMDDLVRKVVKDLYDDENDSHELCQLIKNLEPAGMTDLNRYAMRKALDKAKTVDHYREILETGRRHREADVVKLAEYRGKKLLIINKIKADREAYQQQMQSWQEGVQQDLSKQQEEAERNIQQQKQGGGSEGSSAPASGF